MQDDTGYIKVVNYEGRKGEVKKVVLLYSGGLDTSMMLKWIQDHYKAEVVALTLDLGQQEDDLAAIKKKAIKMGAVSAHVLDVKEEFAKEYLTHMIKANAKYQGDYYISTVSRYLMAKWAIVVAAREGADAVAHGATGKGNDQVRLDASILTLNPEMKVIAPVREWNMSRDEQIDYAMKHKIPVRAKKDFPYSDDDNMWGMTWEGGEVEDPSQIPQVHKFLTATRTLDKTPEKADIVKLEFQRGIPRKLNGKTMKLSDLIMKLNKMGGKHGVGVEYHVEDRLVGLKTRGVYEHPGAHIIIKAHKNLEKYVCTRLENELKEEMDIKFGYLAYGALWYDPAMDDIRAFNDKINEKVDGEVQVQLHKGHAIVVAMTSPHGLHHVSFDNTDERAQSFNVLTAAPFIDVYSMQMRLAQKRSEKSALLSIGKTANKKKLVNSAKQLEELGYVLYATEQTHTYLLENSIPNYLVNKIHEKEEPNLKTMMDERRFDLVINIPTDDSSFEKKDGAYIRKKAVEENVPIYTSVDTAKAHITKLHQAQFGKWE